LRAKVRTKTAETVQIEMEEMGRTILMDFLLKLRSVAGALGFARTFIAFGGEG
jgi:hypothetical protein